MLALKYRPQELSDVVGQKSVSALLSAMIKKNMIPNALLFAGPRGTGKTSTARILAREILKKQGEENSDFVEIDAASHGGVEDIRRLRGTVYFSGTRIFILDEAHSMSREAFNALLKLMEEPPEHVTFILVTTEPGKIPETIKSRCMQFDFRRISAADIYSRLVHVVDAEERPDVEPELLEYISFKASGGLRDALMMLDQALRSEIYSVEQYRELLGELDCGPAILFSCTESQAKAASTLRGIQAHLSTEEIIESLIQALTDSILLREGVNIPRSGSAFEARKELTAAISPGQCVKILKILWALKTQSRDAISPEFLELGVVLISEIFNETQTTAATQKASVVKSPVKKATMTDLQNL